VLGMAGENEQTPAGKGEIITYSSGQGWWTPANSSNVALAYDKASGVARCISNGTVVR